MALGTPEEELAKVTNCESHTSELRERFEDDFEDSRLEDFSMPKAEGKFENFTNNYASTDALSIIDTLASGEMRIWIPQDDSYTEDERGNISNTERFVYGCLSLNDSIKMTIPEVLPLQESTAWSATVRGWICRRVFLYKDDDGKVIPDIAFWDILNTRWISGDNGLIWACYKRYATPEELEKSYNKKFTPDKNGRVVVHDVFDSDQEGVIVSKDWVKKEDHKIGHVPVLILPMGSTPFVQSGRHNDTMKNVGESWNVNNRYMNKLKSRIDSYFLTMVGQVVKTPLQLEYDSTKGGKAVEFEGGSPYEKGAVANVDVGKGQSIKTMVKPEMTRDVFTFAQEVGDQLRNGSRAPISSSMINRGMPAAGMSMVNHVSMKNMRSFIKGMERTEKWTAHELVSQYKSGDFGAMELRGVVLKGIEGSNRQFRIKVTPDQIDDSWDFLTELMVNLPQDDMANMGMAVQGVESKIWSLQTAREVTKKVKDTDLEQQRVDEEMVYSLPQLKLRKLAARMMESDPITGQPNDPEGAMYIMMAIDEMTAQAEPKGVASQPGARTPVRPSGTVIAAQNQAPTPKAPPSAMRRFLSRVGVTQ